MDVGPQSKESSQVPGAIRRSEVKNIGSIFSGWIALDDLVSREIIVTLRLSIFHSSMMTIKMYPPLQNPRENTACKYIYYSGTGHHWDSTTLTNKRRPKEGLLKIRHLHDDPCETAALALRGVALTVIEFVNHAIWPFGPGSCVRNTE